MRITHTHTLFILIQIKYSLKPFFLTSYLKMLFIQFMHNLLRMHTVVSALYQVLPKRFPGLYLSSHAFFTNQKVASSQMSKVKLLPFPRTINVSSTRAAFEPKSFL